MYFGVMRLHDFPGFTVFGTIRLPILLTILCCFFFFSYTLEIKRLTIIKITLFFILMEGLRGALGFLILQDFVLNDALQFYTWRDLVLNLLSMMVPVVYIMGNTQGIRKLINFKTS
jgi:hypothetical protein